MAVCYCAPVSLYPCNKSTLRLFQPRVISAMDQFGPGSFLSSVQVEIVRYIIYNRVMVLETCQNFVNFY